MSNLNQMAKIVRGEIYIANLTGGRGSEYKQEEVKARRPVVIIQNDIGNQYSSNTIVCPISKGNTTRSVTQCKILSVDMKEESFIKAEHIRTICKTRLEKKVGILNAVDIARLEEALLLNLGYVDEDLLWDTEIHRQVKYSFGDIIQVDLSDEEARGTELKGKTLSVVVSNNKGNLYSPVITIVPMKICPDKNCISRYPTQVEAETLDTGLSQKYIIATEFIRTIDKEERILRKVGQIKNKGVLQNIKDANSISLGLLKF